MEPTRLSIDDVTPDEWTRSAWKMQVGGSHYKGLAIQPLEYSLKNKLDAAQHTIIKYVTRFRDKGGVDDLLKARHTLDILIEYERSQAKP